MTDLEKKITNITDAFFKISLFFPQSVLLKKKETLLIQHARANHNLYEFLKISRQRNVSLEAKKSNKLLFGQQFTWQREENRFFCYL